MKGFEVKKKTPWGITTGRYLLVKFALLKNIFRWMRGTWESEEQPSFKNGRF
jgi:hypothetical protein